MSHCYIKDPETGLWNCWSTVVDDYLFDEWVPEIQLKAAIAADAIMCYLVISSEEFKAEDYPENLITYSLDGNECHIIIKDINKIRLTESDWYTKEECDKKKALLEKCKNCTHELCDECDDGDHFVPKA